MIETKLAPSVAGSNSKLNLRFSSSVDAERSEDLTVPEIPLVMNRNQITVVEINYNKITGVLEIWTYIHEEWTMIHQLDIQMDVYTFKRMVWITLFEKSCNIAGGDGRYDF